jgi:hypothetical protein
MRVRLQCISGCLPGPSAPAGLPMQEAVFRKTTATILESAGPTSRQLADQLGHAQTSTTVDDHFGRHRRDPEDLERHFVSAWPMPRRWWACETNSSLR